MAQLWVIRIQTTTGEFSELWNPEIPFSLGHPLRWVLEYRKEQKTLRLTDTTKTGRVETPIRENELLAEFRLNGATTVRVQRETASHPSTCAQSESFGTREASTRFRRAIYQSAAALAVIVLTLPLLTPKTRTLVAGAPVQIVDLKQFAQKSAAPRKAAGNTVASRLRSLVQGSPSKWLARMPASTLSGKWSDRYTANFGNLAASNALGLSALGRQTSAVGGGTGKNWVNLDSLAATVEEGLSRDEVGEVIHRHMKEVRYCYETAMIRQPDLEGKLIVQFTIGNQGSVRSTGVKTSTLPDARLDECILARLAGWKFPHPKGGIDVAVTYPFIFKTLGK